MSVYSELADLQENVANLNAAIVAAGGTASSTGLSGMAEITQTLPATGFGRLPKPASGTYLQVAYVPARLAKVSSIVYDINTVGIWLDGCESSGFISMLDSANFSSDGDFSMNAEGFEWEYLTEVSGYQEQRTATVNLALRYDSNNNNFVFYYKKDIQNGGGYECVLATANDENDLANWGIYLAGGYNFGADQELMAFRIEPYVDSNSSPTIKAIDTTADLYTFMHDIQSASAGVQYGNPQKAWRSP